MDLTYMFFLFQLVSHSEEINYQLFWVDMAIVEISLMIFQPPAGVYKML